MVTRFGSANSTATPAATASCWRNSGGNVSGSVSMKQAKNTIGVETNAYSSAAVMSSPAPRRKEMIRPAAIARKRPTIGSRRVR